MGWLQRGTGTCRQRTTSHRTIRTLLDDGRYAEAKAAAEAALQSAHGDLAAGSPTPPGSGSVLDLLVEARWKNGEVSPETLEEAERAVAARDQSASLDRARSLRNLGRTLLLAGRAANAVDALEMGVKTLEGEPQRDAFADALESLTLGLVELARYDDAEQALKRALQARQAGGPDRPRVRPRPGAARTRLPAERPIRAGTCPSGPGAHPSDANRPHHPETAMALLPAWGPSLARRTPVGSPRCLCRVRVDHRSDAAPRPPRHGLLHKTPGHHNREVGRCDCGALTSSTALSAWRSEASGRTIRSFQDS